MGNPVIQRRMKLIAGTLRLLANAVEGTTSISEMAGIMAALHNSVSVVNLAYYEFQKDLINNAKHDLATHDY